MTQAGIIGRVGCGGALGMAINGIIFVVLISSIGGFCKASKISFEEGAYENILIALNEHTEEKDCRDIVNAVTETFTMASTYLTEVTDGRAKFGTLRILIPRGWAPASCNSSGFVPAKKDDIYEAADIKITEHPIAMKLPWAEQHQGCGKSGEVIYTPPSFLTDKTFNLEQRSRIFLHEWMKFRYGVFEEYGFLNDKYYPPCFNSSGGVHFTSCTTPRLSQLEEISSDLDCGALLERKKDDLLKQLETVSSSILFAPHLINNTTVIKTSLCSNETHNVAARSKQNFHCDRKSAGDIVFSHADFRLNSKLSKLSSTENLKAELVSHPIKVSQAYAFVIEDTIESHGKNKIRHVKQSIAEFLHFVDESNMAFLLRFGAEICTDGPLSLDKYTIKKDFLSKISDTDSICTKIVTNTTENIKDATLLNVFTTLNNSLNIYNSRDKWNVIFIGDTTPTDLSTTLEFVKQTDLSLSIVTFDSSKEWLRWNGIKQTKKLLYLPVCDEKQSPCSTITSSLLTDHLLEILSSQQPKRYFQKVIDVDFRGKDVSKSFTPQIISDLNYKKFLLSFPRYDSNTTASVTHPAGANCVLNELYNFSGLLFTNSSGSSGCDYQTGTWVVNLMSVPADKLNITHVLRGYVEVEGKPGIVVMSSVGIDITKEIFPSAQNMLVPIHVAVKTAADEPVIKAEVDAKISFGNTSGVFTTDLLLADDGIDPDITKNDGIYSGFVFGYSEFPSFHSGVVNVKTTLSTEVVTSIQASSTVAALLDKRLETKCCGHSVPVDKVSQVGQMYYHSVLSSFRTGEHILNPLVSPPSRIVLVEEVEQTQEFLQVQFVAPKGDVRGGKVDHYDLCLLCDDCKCKDIPTNECLPVLGGELQYCKIDKTGLLETFVNPAEVGDKTEITITCGIRGVNGANLSGAVSFNPIEIFLLTENGTSAPLLECNYISDGCLPITIFWILIGLMSGLVLILVVVLLCWFCMARNDKAKNKETVTNQSEKLSRVHSGRTLRSKASDKNGTIDEFGTRDLFSQTMHRPPSPDEPVDNSFLSNIRRRSTSSVDIPSRFHSNEIPTVKLSSSPELRRDMDEMPVFFANGTVQNPRISKSSFKIPENASSHYEKKSAGENYFSQRNSRVPSNQFQQSHAYPNSSVRNSNATLAVPSVSSMVDMQMSNESLNYREPVYASVNRNGRRSGSNLVTDRNSGMSLPPNMSFQHSNNGSHLFSPYTNSTKSVSPHPQSLHSLDSGINRSQSPIRSLPPIRMDHFPSSESETYSEMSRGGGNPPPPPPPMPTSLNATSGIPRRHRVDTSKDDSKEITITPRFVSRTPPKENGFGILAKMGPIPDRKSVLKPRGGPPPPPPPRSNSVRKPPPNYTNTSAYTDPYNSRKSNPDFEQNENNFDDENDSDTWDVYDEFEFNPGVSHV
ncbi:unnamed protein product [Allacma fusca]|uniref:Calcium-activated chloride channel N-terminal domain-containing protein n=1 Tax=Allacma fusca TaxID=39272 RepID=A0A8J2L4B6_9HEXA|nr:unnamed protein product [Allacma fusca]